MIQYHSHAPFDGPWEAVIKTIVMMTSEFEYEDIFGDDHNKELSSSKPLVHLLFLFFLIFVSIVFVNFMVGVAVSDVNDLKVDGHIRRLQKQVEFLNTLDVLAFGCGFKCWGKNYCASRGFISKRYVNSITIKAGITKTWMARYELETNDEISMLERKVSLPSHILDNIFNKIKSKKEHNKEEKEFHLLREQVNFIYNFATGFIDKYLTDEKELIRETKVSKVAYRFKPKVIEDIEKLKDNVSNTEKCLNYQRPQRKPSTRIHGASYIGTRIYFTNRLTQRKRNIMKNQIIQELKINLAEETNALRKSQLKRYKKIERMLKKL